MICFTVSLYLENSGLRVYCTAILYIAFPGFLKEINQMWSYNSFSLYIVILKKNQILKGSLVRKKYCIMIRGKFMALSKTNDGGKSRNVFWQEAPPCFTGFSIRLWWWLLLDTERAFPIKQNDCLAYSLVRHNQHLFLTI